MLTTQQIKKQAYAFAKNFDNWASEQITFEAGATWANDQNATRIAELEAKNAELIEALNKLLEASKSAATQINFLLEVYHKFCQK